MESFAFWLSSLTPELDVLPFAFYSLFWEVIKDMIVAVFWQCVDSGEPPQNSLYLIEALSH